MMIKHLTILTCLFASFTAFADDPTQPVSNDDVGVTGIVSFEQQVQQRQQQLRQQQEQLLLQQQQQAAQQAEQAKQAAPETKASVPAWQQALTPQSADSDTKTTPDQTSNPPAPAATNNAAPTSQTAAAPAAPNSTTTAVEPPKAPTPQVSPGTGYIPMMQDPNAKKNSGKIQYY